MEFSKDTVKPRMLVLVDYMNQLWPAVVIDVFKAENTPSKKKQGDRITVMWLDKICTESTVSQSKIVPFVKSWFKAYVNMNQKKGSQVKEFNESLVLALKLAAGDSYVGITVDSLPDWMKSGKKIHRDTISDGELHFLLCQGKLQREAKKRKSNSQTSGDLLPLVNRICAFKCKESACDERFSTAQDRDWHNFTFHKGWYTVCQQCKEIFEWKGDAEKHIKEEHPECLDADDEIPEIGVLKRMKMIQCSTCDSLVGTSEEDQAEHKEECEHINDEGEGAEGADQEDEQEETKKHVNEKQRKQRPKLKVAALTRDSLQKHSAKRKSEACPAPPKKKAKKATNKLSDETVSSSSTKEKPCTSSISPPRSDSPQSTDGAPSEELNATSPSNGEDLKCHTCNQEFCTTVERIVHEAMHKQNE